MKPVLLFCGYGDINQGSSYFVSHFSLGPADYWCGWGQGKTRICSVHIIHLFLPHRQPASEPSSWSGYAWLQSVHWLLARWVLLAPSCLSKTSRTAYGPRYLPNAWATNPPSPDFRKPTACQIGGQPGICEHMLVALMLWALRRVELWTTSLSTGYLCHFSYSLFLAKKGQEGILRKRDFSFLCPCLRHTFMQLSLLPYQPTLGLPTLLMNPLPAF
jgi:hypothetical protein